MITQSELKEVLSYDEMTGQFVWINPKTNRLKIGDVAGWLNNKGYLHIKIGKASYKCHRLAWLYVYGEFPDGQLDHVNGNKNDNRINNLRSVSNKENGENRKLHSSNTSGHRGISWNKKSNKWTATVRHLGQLHHIGQYSVLEDAVKAVKEARNLFFTHHQTCYSS